jgi:pimeloyl-ACP methyl ester carboxylesterase
MADVLAYDRVTAEGAEPAQWLFVLHGIFGAGRNWGSVMRRVVTARPDWGALLVDLRQHGGSQNMPGPHTIAAAVRDIERLIDSTAITPSAVLGHSFGGKVALVFARDASPDARRALRQVWVVDSTPAKTAPGGSAWNMLKTVRQLPTEFQSRSALVDALVAHGTGTGVAQWMATNLESQGNVYRWRIDFDAMDELLHSFFETDAWQVVDTPPEGVDMHIVKAEDSTVLSGDALARVERAAPNGHTFLHRVAGGHWVNAENPEAIVTLLVQMLPPA